MRRPTLFCATTSQKKNLALYSGLCLLYPHDKIKDVYRTIFRVSSHSGAVEISSLLGYNTVSVGKQFPTLIFFESEDEGTAMNPNVRNYSPTKRDIVTSQKT
jgi:hypothetical protein